jgi:hypothetical protein
MKPKTHAPVSTVVVTACPKPMRTPFCSPSGTATATGRGILLRHVAPFGGLGSCRRRQPASSLPQMDPSADPSGIATVGLAGKPKI